jgi:phosphoglycolate phosphatase
LDERRILFDLDGTLIDSAPSILRSLEAVFADSHLTPCRPFSADLIGPPLGETMRGLLTPQDEYRADALVEAFKQHYDNADHRLTCVYDGVPAMLRALSEAGITLTIATNKRIAPTIRILADVGWSDYFDGVFSLDYFIPPLRSKSEMLQRLVRDLEGGVCLYVGDRDEDGQAAAAAGLPFLLVRWGYGGSGNSEGRHILHPDQLRPSLIESLLV